MPKFKVGDVLYSSRSINPAAPWSYIVCIDTIQKEGIRARHIAINTYANKASSYHSRMWDSHQELTTAGYRKLPMSTDQFNMLFHLYTDEYT